MLCYKNDRRPFGASSSDRWFYGWLDNGVEGYIWADQIANQARVPSCSAYGAPLAADWALGQLGVAYVPGGTPSNYWSGYCALFVYDSWLSYGNSPFMAPTAYQWYTKYATVPALPGSTGVNGRTRPPRGAYVWFGQTAGNAAAHVGLSLGNWQMVTTQGFDGDTKPVTVRGILDFEKVTGARYLGWSWPNAQAASAPFNNSGNGVVP